MSYLGILGRVALVRTDVSEKCIASNVSSVKGRRRGHSRPFSAETRVYGATVQQLHTLWHSIKSKE
jgi:hypothetical protein